MTGLWINRFFLAGLSKESYAVQKKAFIFVWLSIILIPLLVIPTIINLATTVSTHPVIISIANISMIIGFIVALILLKKGLFNTAMMVSIAFVSLRVIIGTLMKLDIWIATGNNNNVYFMFAALAFTAFFGTRRQQLAMSFAFIAINIGVVIFAMAISAPEINLLIGSTINVVITIIITMSLSWLISFITERSLKTTEEELRKNIALSKALEEKVHEVISMNTRLESMNAELHKRSIELTEANKNLMIFKNFAEESGQGLGMSQIDGTVIYANSALTTLLGKENKDSLVNEKFIDNYPADIKFKVVKEIVPEVLKIGQWVGELPLQTSTGRVIPTIQNIFLIRDVDTNPLYLALVVTDLTERKQLEMKLLMSQKLEMIGKLAAGIIHDFNNILTAIMGSSEMLLRNIEPGDPRRRYAEEIKKEGQLSAGIFRQLLAFSKNQIVKTTDFDLNYEIDSLQKILRHLIREDIEMVIEYHKEPLYVHADPSQIGQVLINLVINACDAMPEGGRIAIKTRSDVIKPGDEKSIKGASPGVYAVLSVEDNGIGLDEETKARLYEPFFSTKDPNKGMGLGLSVVYGIVQQHKGWISVTSSRGVGTAFDVFLPLTKSKMKSEEKHTMRNRSRHGHGEKILVVEDQDRVRSIAVSILRENDFMVFEASCAEDAEEIFEIEAGNIDLLFTDVVLPGKSGLQLVETLREKKQGLLVLLASGYAEQRNISDIIKERGYLLLHKPYSMEDLLESVGKILHKDKNFPC